jgi:hypothetical protein
MGASLMPAHGAAAAERPRWRKSCQIRSTFFCKLAKKMVAENAGDVSDVTFLTKRKINDAKAW